MRVLVVSDGAELREDLISALVSCRRTVRGCALHEAKTEIRSAPPDVLVVHVKTTEDLAALSAFSALAETMYVLALLPADVPGRMFAAAIAAGSQDVLQMPYSREELGLRVDARERLCRWIAPGKEQPQGAVPTIRAWQYLDTVVADDLEGMLCTTVSMTERPMPRERGIQRATIPMTLPAVGMDLCISIAADEEARKWLGGLLLGDEAASDEVIRDIMRELANLVGGAFKRAALAERLTVSTGIPVDNDPAPCGPNARYWQIEVAGCGTIGMIADVRAKPNRRVPARRLVEGMVVVQDIVNGSGLLLLPSGTRLTSTTAERLSRLLDQALIDVCA